MVRNEDPQRTDRVQTHVRNLYRKLSVHSRYQALEEARRLRLLDS